MRTHLSFLALTASAALGLGLSAAAQQGPPSGAYSGVSQPPDDAIMASPEAAPVIPKPSAAVVAQPADTPAPAVSQSPAYQDSGYRDSSYRSSSSDAPPADAYAARYSSDPDGDMVHPRPARPGELPEGATIRVRLLDRLSSAQSEKGEPFHGQVASDVMQDGKVLIPSGSAIEGQVSAVTTGHFGGHGSLRLRPESVILPDGTRFQLHAYTTGTRGSNTRIGSEGAINPGSRKRKDGIEYGAVVGTGLVAGAIIAGPVGALTGGLIGAGVVTTHLMVDHPQATLEPNTVILFTLTESMNLTPYQN